MPYIKQERRDVIFQEADLGAVVGDSVMRFEYIEAAGEIQYAIAVILKDFMERKGLSYQNCNDVMGALSGAQMEFYRKVVAPYEEEKEKTNGSV